MVVANITQLKCIMVKVRHVDGMMTLYAQVLQHLCFAEAVTPLALPPPHLKCSQTDAQAERDEGRSGVQAAVWPRK